MGDPQLFNTIAAILAFRIARIVEPEGYGTSKVSVAQFDS